jgi:uncharacterized protein YecE (DUF72 family)
MDIWIGTSGYSYRDWVGGFYPPGTRPERMLEHYARHFPLVELNFTFYRPPTPGILERLAQKTPAPFQFLVKLPQTISHEESARDLPGFRQAVEVLRKRHQLAGLLCQLPQSTHSTRRTCDWLAKLGRELSDLRLAVEFRHRSWARPGLPGWLAEHNLDLVAVDAPDIPALFPSGWTQSGPRVYVRLHSRNAGNWYKSDNERYDFDYSDSALNEWVDVLGTHEVLGDTERALFLFNNCHRSQAANNARRLHTLIEERAPQLHVVEPFAAGKAETPVQRSLFS